MSRRQTNAFLEGYGIALDHAAIFMLRGLKEGNAPEEIAKSFRDQAVENRKLAGLAQ